MSVMADTTKTTALQKSSDSLPGPSGVREKHFPLSLTFQQKFSGFFSKMVNNLRHFHYFAAPFRITQTLDFKSQSMDWFYGAVNHHNKMG